MSLCVATKSRRSFDAAELSCTAEQVFGVIKSHDPVGSTGTWLVDDGGELRSI